MSLENNKIAGGLLLAGVIAGTAGFAADLLYGGGRHDGEHAYKIAITESAVAAVSEAAPEVDMMTLLASADVAKGEKVAKKCSACHSFNAGGPDKIGPNLYDVVNRSIGANSGFGYSGTLADMSDKAWSFENLDGFLAKPKDWAPGTKMAFAGLKKPTLTLNCLLLLQL